MKKSLLIALVSAAACAPFAAQAQSYVGASVGNSDQKFSVEGYGSESLSGTGFRLSVGSQLSQYFGVEAGFVKLANVEVTTGDTSFTSKPQTYYVAGTGSYPLANGLALTGKLGMAFNRTKLSIDGSSATFKENAPLLGIGMTYAFTSGLSAVAEYETYGKLFKEEGVKIEGSMFSIGLRFNY